MDDYGYEQFANEYPLFPPPDNENNFPATIDPAMLQNTSVPDFDYPFEQQQGPAWDGQGRLIQPFGSNLGLDLGPPAHVHREQSHARQHLIVSKSPFLCHCGQNFTRLCSLERHVQNNTGQLQPEYPCPECPAYQGKNGFKRKDHLVQHLRVLHNWDNNQLATLFPPRQTRKFNIPVCHFPECDYYRDPSFKDMGIREQEENRPFDKQSHYTDHMKREHDWSPYPCKVSGCSKVNGTGFFSTTTLEKHYKKKHPGSAIPAPKVQDPTTQTVRCDCGKSFKRSNIAYHQEYQCKSLAPCRYCHERIVASDMGDHCRNNCKGCLERMVYGQLWEHEANYCKGEAQCHKCSMRMERRLLGYRHFCILCRVRI